MGNISILLIVSRIIKAHNVTTEILVYVVYPNQGGCHYSLSSYLDKHLRIVTSGAHLRLYECTTSDRKQSVHIHMLYALFFVSRPAIPTDLFINGSDTSGTDLLSHFSLLSSDRLPLTSRRSSCTKVK